MTQPISDAEILEIVTLLRAATPDGEKWLNGYPNAGHVHRMPDHVWTENKDLVANELSSDHAALIAAAPEALRKLLAEVTSLRRQLGDATEALERITTQHFGLMNSWAGMWADCQKCKTMFAYSWNWSNDPESPAPAKCPTCRALDFLAQSRRSDAKAEKGAE